MEDIFFSSPYKDNNEKTDQDYYYEFTQVIRPEANFQTAEQYLKKMSDLDVILFNKGKAHNYIKKALGAESFIDNLCNDYLNQAVRKKVSDILQKRAEWCQAIDQWEEEKDSEFIKEGKDLLGKDWNEYAARFPEFYVEAHLKFGDVPF